MKNKYSSLVKAVKETQNNSPKALAALKHLVKLFLCPQFLPENRKYFLVYLATLMAFTFQINAQSFLTTQGTNIVNEEGETVILRGMGLGGWMVQEGYMLQTAEFASPQHQIKEHIEELIGKEGMETFYDAWLTNYCQKVDIDSMKAWGFNSVRLPLHYNLFTLPIEDEPVAGEHTWIDKGFVMTDSVISWCKQNDMYVILDLHAAPGGQGYDQGISDYDPDKPSLWESAANKDKMIWLWSRLAERYVDEPTVGGYDLLNEPNWSMDGNGPLRALYETITDSIRVFDDKHIIFIEGNWFANDFTNLTPPWDDKLVYSPHKYWSFNSPTDLDWVLSLRDEHNVPLYLGESGENSNTWYRDAINLLETNGVGWAWWTLKKVESISGTMSITKTDSYENLLNYWKSDGAGTAPSVASATNTLMELAENLKLENCTFNKDVIDAMFRQVNSEETIPFNTQTIPGIVYASDYDMGRNEHAYYDLEVADYHVSTGDYTAWNSGWAYRNDGVDIEPSPDGNGYKVGFLEKGEWMEYDVLVEEDGVYEIDVRVSTPATTGRLHFSADGSDLCNLRYVPVTGGYNVFQSLPPIPNVVLTTENNKIRFHSDGYDFNLSSFEFTKTGEIADLETAIVSAVTLDQQRILVHINKPLAELPIGLASDFEAFVDGTPVPVTAVEQSDNPRSFILTIDYSLLFNNEIQISYSGNDITAFDDSKLGSFSFANVVNNLPDYFNVPGRIEAENYIDQSGVQLEDTSDDGGGQNVGYLDPGDYLDYNIFVTQSGIYNVNYRIASEQSGQLKMQLLDANGEASDLHTVDVFSTSGWQNWTSVSQSVNLPQGAQTIRLLITESPFNLNWFEFELLTSLETIDNQAETNLYPNPNSGRFQFKIKYDEPLDLDIRIYNSLGETVLTESIENTKVLNKDYDISQLNNGTYYMVVYGKDGSRNIVPFVKVE